jgi:ribosomal protein L13
MGMLSKNTLQNYIGRKLRIFPGEQHLHENMLPQGENGAESILK